MVSGVRHSTELQAADIEFGHLTEIVLAQFLKSPCFLHVRVFGQEEVFERGH